MESKFKCNDLKDAEMRVAYENAENDKWTYENKTKSNHINIFSTPFRYFFKEVFLPQGFPESVHSDYIPYQIWDTVQAFASTILGTLATHSIMRAVGVGDSKATPLAAAITWIVKDGAGMLGRILFAWWKGPELDAQCKKWRLFADILNDLAMGIELSMPYFSSCATTMLCITSVMKSLVGVAGGATRAAITQHQALSNNLADVSAKDGSQETCVNLIASLVGILVLSYTNVSSFLEFYYVILVAVHIYANYSAVRSLRFEIFNENRLALVVKSYLTRSLILDPEEINRLESLAPFQNPTKEMCGFDIVIGGSLRKFMPSRENNSNKIAKAAIALKDYRKRRAEQFYGAAKDRNTRTLFGFIVPDVEALKLYVALEKDITSSGIIDMYFEAFLRGIYLSMDLDLRPDIIHEAKMTTGPLSSLYKKIKQGRDDNLGSASDIHSFIENECTKWSKLLDNSDWVREINLLPVGPFRSYWEPRKLISDCDEK